MTILALLRMFGALAMVLGLLGGALWAVRRFDIRLPGRLGGGATPDKRLEVVERLTVDQKRSLLLVRRDNVEHLVLMAPEGNVVLHEARTDAPALRLLESPVTQPPIAAPVEPVAVAMTPMFDAARDGGDVQGSTSFLSNLERFQSFANARIADHA